MLHMILKRDNTNIEKLLNFPFCAPQEFIARIKNGDLNDPLLRQILPSEDELKNIAGFSCDPLNEKSAEKAPHLLHKYYGRILLLVTNHCVINCRFCFRRTSFLKDSRSDHNFDEAFKYILNNKTISEVILSGGDPLILPPEKLLSLFEKLAAIPHVKRVRIHSRIPIVMPSKITDDLIKAITATRFSPILVVHCNHANEIDEHIKDAIGRLRAAKINVLNQSVLLHGVNDSVDALVALSEKLTEIGIIPYYLHLLDKVSGTTHFTVPINAAKLIHSKLQELLPGYLVPKLVYEKAGAKSKIAFS